MKEASAKRGFSFAGASTTLGLFGVYVLLVLVLSRLSPYFFSVNNFLNILVAVSTIGIIAVRDDNGDYFGRH